jgi:predicted nucleotidyltransferase
VIATDRDLEWIVGRIVARYDTTAVYLFGSYARGSPRDGSDIDLIVVGPSRLPPPRRGSAVAADLASFPLGFDLLFYTDEELADERRDPASFASVSLRNSRLLFGGRPCRSPDIDERLGRLTAPAGAGLSTARPV